MAKLAGGGGRKGRPLDANRHHGRPHAGTGRRSWRGGAAALRRCAARPSGAAHLSAQSQARQGRMGQGAEAHAQGQACEPCEPRSKRSPARLGNPQSGGAGQHSPRLSPFGEWVQASPRLILHVITLADDVADPQPHTQIKGPRGKQSSKILRLNVPMRPHGDTYQSRRAHRIEPTSPCPKGRAISKSHSIPSMSQMGSQSPRRFRRKSGLLYHRCHTPSSWRPPDRHTSLSGASKSRNLG